MGVVNSSAEFCLKSNLFHRSILIIYSHDSAQGFAQSKPFDSEKGSGANHADNWAAVFCSDVEGEQGRPPMTEIERQPLQLFSYS